MKQNIKEIDVVFTGVDKGNLKYVKKYVENKNLKYSKINFFWIC